MNSYILMVNKDDNKQTWGCISDEMWFAILENFVAKHANYIAFEGIEDVTGLSKIQIFHEKSLEPVAKCDIEWVWENIHEKTLSMNYSIAKFNYDEKVQAQLEEVKFSYWDKLSDDFPVDTLLFFHDEELLFSADNLEGVILFPHLTEVQLANLVECHPEIEINLHQIPKRTVTILCK